MASTSSKQSSRFSTFKVFKFSGSKPPPPPPKDPNYLYSVSNRSALSFSNQSLSVDSLSQPPTPHSTSPQSVARSPSPAPSRATQSPASSSALGPNSAGSKKGFFNFGSLRKRSLSRSSQRTTVEDVPDDESISMPWNFQHHIHVDEGFHGIPPGWTASLAEAGFSESEILAIQQARRARSPAQESTYPPPSAFSYSRSQSPSSIAASTTLVNPRRRSSSLRSNASLSRSERSGSGKHAPPPLPIATRKHSASGSTGAPPVDQSFIEIDGTDSVAAHSDANFVYVDHSKRDTTVTITPERSLADSPEALTSTFRAAASSSSSSRATPPRPIDTTRSRSRTPPRKTFRVVNETPPDGMSPSLTSLEAWRPLPQEKMSSRSPPQQELPPVAQEEAGQSTNGRANRPPKLSILPPRLSLRKDTLEDLSSWTEALFSAIPSATESSPTSAARTLSATPVDSSKASSSRIPPWQQLTNPVPNILLNSSPREEEDEDEYEAEADLSFTRPRRRALPCTSTRTRVGGP
ncbi:hypothetical protein FA95DRAFT_1321051 [Auriscalpium vulgare]|uniref:Uncharacterized protein n=1 Tax=Auriscalpium vulgare TaxID=40419 RepID=A0ACB8S949_9AGAM|nr:hypothetical protein FA95DRAFT_1321051 [Auriscalpium vulgare]